MLCVHCDAPIPTERLEATEFDDACDIAAVDDCSVCGEPLSGEYDDGGGAWERKQMGVG